MNCTVLDLETYYDRTYSLKRLSIPEYVHDPRFRVHGIAIRWPNGDAEFRTDLDVALAELRGRFGDRLERTTVVGHHLQFDLYALNHRYDLRPTFFIDTMLLAYHVHGRREKRYGQSASLAALAELYGLPAKQDLDFMTGVRNPDVRQLAELSTYAKHDVALTYQLAERLLPQITRPDVELPLLMHTVRLFTERSICVDVAGINPIEQQVREDSARFFELAGVTPAEMSKNSQFVPLLEAALARTGRALSQKPGKRGMIPAIAKTDATMQALLDDDDPVVEALAHARLNKKGEDQKLARLTTLRNIAEAIDGTLPPYLVYYGSHTGRFAGGGGFNVQNLGRDGLGAKIRGLLIPRPGHKFIIADLAQIEARITAWYAGELGMLEAFAQNRDLYSEFAARVFDCEVRRPTEGDPPSLRERLGCLRQVGKRAVLGLGFEMGALKFMVTLQSDVEAAKLFANGDLSPLICRDIVRSFRAEYPGIPRFWKMLEEAARAVIDGNETDVGTLHFGRSGNVTLLRLPSGRALRYPDLRLCFESRVIKHLDENGELAEFEPDEPSLVYGKQLALYGGKLCENVVQAAARDLLVESILRLESLGLPVLFHVHDEVIVEVSLKDVEQSLRIVERELSQTPSWAPDLPVACEVRVADRYGK